MASNSKGAKSAGVAGVAKQHDSETDKPGRQVIANRLQPQCTGKRIKNEEKLRCAALIVLAD